MCRVTVARSKTGGSTPAPGPSPPRSAARRCPGPTPPDRFHSRRPHLIGDRPQARRVAAEAALVDQPPTGKRQQMLLVSLQPQPHPRLRRRHRPADGLFWVAPGQRRHLPGQHQTRRAGACAQGEASDRRGDGHWQTVEPQQHGEPGVRDSGGAGCWGDLRVFALAARVRGGCCLASVRFSPTVVPKRRGKVDARPATFGPTGNWK